MALNCLDTKLNLGASPCKKAPELLRGIISTPEGYTITAADAATVTQWQSDILLPAGSRIYLWPKWAVNFEDVSSDETREDTPLSSLPVFPGQHRWRLFFKENLNLHKAMYSHSGTNGRAFVIDHEGKIIGTSDDDGVTLKGFLLDELNVAKLKVNDGSVSTKSAVTLYTAVNTELDDNGFMVEGSSFLSGLESLTSVVLAIASPAATATNVFFSVKSALDNVPISGLVLADIDDDLTGTVSTLTETPAGSGIYDLAGTSLATGTINLVAAASLSIQAYESTGALAITI